VHQVQLDGGIDVQAMCALDALGIPQMTRRDARIRSTDPVSGQPITVEAQAAAERARFPDSPTIRSTAATSSLAAPRPERPRWPAGCTATSMVLPAGPRRYRVHAGGRPVGSGKGCSVDMYLLALALGRPIHAEATCPATGTSITVDIPP
jgi:hypothetical protein